MKVYNNIIYLNGKIKQKFINQKGYPKYSIELNNNLYKVNLNIKTNIDLKTYIDKDVELCGYLKFKLLPQQNLKKLRSMDNISFHVRVDETFGFVRLI